MRWKTKMLLQFLKRKDEAYTDKKWKVDLSVPVFTLVTALILVTIWPQLLAQRTPPVPVRPGQLIDREILGKESHEYGIAVTKGDYLQVSVESFSSNLTFVLNEPHSRRTEGNRVSLMGFERTKRTIAENTETYVLSVVSFEAKGEIGRYQITLELLRPATATDTDRIKAQEIFEEGKRLAHSGDNQLVSATARLTDALHLFRDTGDHSGEADALESLADVYKRSGRLQESLGSYDAARNIWRDLDRPHAEARVLLVMAWTYSNYTPGCIPSGRHGCRGDTLKALEAYRGALEVERTINDNRGAASTLELIAKSEENKSQAIAHLEEGLLLITGRGSRKMQSRLLEATGRLHLLMGQYKEGQPYIDQALAVLRELDDRFSEASLLGNLGRLYLGRYQYEKAFDHFNAILAMPTSTETNIWRADAFLIMGSLFRKYGDYHNALHYFESGHTLERESGYTKRDPRYDIELASIYTNLADYETALKHIDTALSLEEYNAGKADNLYVEGNIYYRKGAYYQAIKCYDQALSTYRSISNRYRQALTLTRLGWAYYRMQQPMDALTYFEAALNTARIEWSFDDEEPVLFGIARVQRELGRLTDAKESVEKALRTVEYTRTLVASRELRTSFFASVAEIYEFYVDLLMEMHRRDPRQDLATKALEVNERARARTLLEALQEANVDLYEGLDANVRENELLLRQQLREQIDHALRSTDRGLKEDAALWDDIDALVFKYDTLQASIRSKDHRYAVLAPAKTLSVKDMQRQVLDEDTALLEYSLGAERSYVWAITRDSMISAVLPKRSEIEHAARAFYADSSNQQGQKWRGARFRPARRVMRDDSVTDDNQLVLSNVLLLPVASCLHKRRLLIVSDGVLQYIPFSTLSDPADSGRAEPLIATHEIVSLFSASTLASHRFQLADRRPPSKAILILADPVFEAGDSRVATRLQPISRQPKGDMANSSATSLRALEAERSVRQLMGAPDGKLHRLSFSRQEAAEIYKLAPPASSLRAVDFDANLRLLMRPETGQYRIVHLATHGILDSEHPELSGLVFSLVDEQAHPQDGFLTLADIYRLKLSADLVVLSACRTGLGKEIKAEGLVGLTRGFLYAGARGVLASLWNVDDAATARLMKDFYTALLSKRLPAASALREAQLAMSKRAAFRSPYYWAGFFLQGDWK
jgi:CHAT domain-containing protein/uncharacterized protein HemY